jgi:hypothetical protein
MAALFLSGLFVSYAPAQKKEAFPAKLQAVTAKLFCNETGTFSKNVLDNPEMDLWNTIIGEGSAGCVSNATFVLIEVVGDGAPNVYSSDALTVTTQAEGKPMLTHHYRHMAFSPYGKHFEGIWLYDTGCLPITITVKVDAQPAVTKKIDFGCGE